MRKASDAKVQNSSAFWLGESQNWYKDHIWDAESKYINFDTKISHYDVIMTSNVSKRQLLQTVKFELVQLTFSLTHQAQNFAQILSETTLTKAHHQLASELLFGKQKKARREICHFILQPPVFNGACT